MDEGHRAQGGRAPAVARLPAPQGAGGRQACTAPTAPPAGRGQVRAPGRSGPTATAPGCPKPALPCCPVLLVHRAARADYLVEMMAEVLAEPLRDALATEVVAVPTRGVERWLSQRLGHSLGATAAPVPGPGAAGPLGAAGPAAVAGQPATAGGDGTCANVDWPSPSSLVTGLVREVTGYAGGARRSGPWAPEVCVWPLVQIVDRHLDDPSLAVLAAHLRASSPPGPSGRQRRFGAVRHLAELFDRYSLYRPRMVREWSALTAGGDSAPPGRFDGWVPPGRLDDVAWQSSLWSRLRAEVGEPSPAELAAQAVEVLVERPEASRLPERVCCFGLTRLPEVHLEVLAALAEARDVHLFLLHPSPTLWRRVAESTGAAGTGHSRASGEVGLAREEGPGAETAVNPLLRSWGRDCRELQLLLQAHGFVAAGHRDVADKRPPTLLSLVQSDIREDREPPGPPHQGEPDRRPLLGGDDRSLQVHSCHGRGRQVEVVREAVLQLLALDPSLEPRDVIVMCPDIEEFAPLVHAVFGTAGLDGGPVLPVRVADRSVRQTNPVLGVAAHLLELAAGRAGAAEVLDFVSRAPVSRRFQLDEDDLSQLERWTEGTGVRWGMDGDHRAIWKMPGFEASTWKAGMERLLLGVAMDDEGELFGGVLPYGDLAGPEVDLAGRLAELVSRLGAAMRRLAGPLSVTGWADALARSTLELCCPERGEEWQVEQFRRQLSDVAARAAAAPPSGGAAAMGGPLLELAEARALFEDELEGRPTRANFRTGDVTVCTLLPMRSVPHRVVCLLGMDDGVFPRPVADDGDDLLACKPMVGDRDPPAEDRQMLLDAVMAAIDHLVITFEGHDQHLNQPRPPAVPVAELLDVVDRTVRWPPAGTDEGLPARRAVLVEHPLQPFHVDNFLPGRLGGPGPWRFDRLQLDGARAATGPRSERPPFLSGRLPPLEDRVVPLASLVRFLEHPVRAFLRTRLGYYPGDVPEPLSDALSLELGPLERWSLGDRLLAVAAAGGDLDKAVAAEQGRGLVPPGALGQAAIEEVRGVVAALVALLEAVPQARVPPRPLEVNVALPDGRAVVGSVPGVHDGTVVRAVYSKLGAKHRLRAWAHFVALSAAHPELSPGAVTLGQAEGSSPDRPRLRAQALTAFGGGQQERQVRALGLLVQLVDLFDRGMREPLPLYCATSAAWAEAVRQGDNAQERARPRWSSPYDERGEAYDPEHLAVFGAGVDLEQLLAEAPVDGEAGPGWPAERTRLGRLAVRLWGPVLEHEKLCEL